jgi:hypothetical protein
VPVEIWACCRERFGRVKGTGVVARREAAAGVRNAFVRVEALRDSFSHFSPKRTSDLVLRV